MKISKYIWKLSLINIKKKQKRTVLSIISVGLSVTIIFTSIILFQNIYNLSRNIDFKSIGDFHYIIQSDEKSEATQRYQMSYEYDSNLFASFHDTHLNLREFVFNDTANDRYPVGFILTHGEYPKNFNELVLDETYGYRVGDVIELNIGEISNNSSSNKNNIEIISEITTISYTVVGLYKNNKIMTNYNNDISIGYTILEEKEGFITYVHDQFVQLSDHYLSLLNKFEVSENSVFPNIDVISIDTINYFLKDTTTLLILFIVIIIIALMISLITIENIILMSDKERKKELGLLKSVGATPLEIKRLLTNELSILAVVGSIVGLVFGLLISYIVLNMFINNLHVPFSFKMILNPIIMLISVVIGVSLMLFSGMKAYNKYIYTYPIYDLKETSHQFELPEKIKRTNNKSFSWKMFVIYNGRMKSQAKNIFQSFTLFIFTMILFFALFISNIIYKNQYKSATSDFEIINQNRNLDNAFPSLDLAYSLYDLVETNQINVESLYNMRRLQNITIYSPKERLNETSLKIYEKKAKHELNTQKIDNKEYVNIQGSAAFLDSYQLRALKEQVYLGSLDNLNKNSLVCVFSDQANKDLYQDLLIGDIIYFDGIPMEVAAIILIDISDSSYPFYFEYERYQRVFGVSVDYLEEYKNLSEMGFLDRYNINLVNKSAATTTAGLIEEIIENSEMTNYYKYDSLLLVRESSRFTSFILESLLYPLFFLLFIISIMNINNVLLSNVHLKRNDISIMKSVGMSNAQLQMLFIFEYIEGYLNASFISIMIFIPICILEGLFKFASAFDLGNNIFATIIITLFTVGIFVIVPLVSLSLKKITDILPIENMKDVI